MSHSEIDSPFNEKKSSRLVWIIPSVALHVIVLIIWFTLPEDPPRKPTDRKLKINSEQAEQLQRHVEDANLVVLRSQVSELQAIKEAMGRIRDRKMAQLRSFEEEMVEDAPRDAVQLFSRLLESQSKIIAAYQQMLLSAQASIEIEPSVRSLLEDHEVESALPLLVEVRDLRDDVDRQMNIVRNETSRIFALINTTEVTISWVQDPSIEKQWSDLNSAMDSAQVANNRVRSSLSQSFSSRSSKYLDDSINKNASYSKTLKDFETANVEGERAVQAKRSELNDRIESSTAAIKSVAEQQAELRRRIDALPENDKTALAELRAQEIELEREKKKVSQQLKKAKLELDKQKDYRPSAKAEKRVKQIENLFRGIFAKKPDLGPITEGLQAQVEFANTVKSLMAALAEKSSTVGGER
tara:strand:- start:15301 stop:16536 length:1236 start_codon:yes stop_codon:yes gene_type:complete